VLQQRRCAQGHTHNLEISFQREESMFIKQRMLVILMADRC
jgi:hypothetical protein